MIFVIQNTQNRDTAAMHIKIDELIRVTGKGRNVLLDLEELDHKTLELLRQGYEQLGKAKSQTKTPIRAGKGQSGEILSEAMSAEQR